MTHPEYVFIQEVLHFSSFLAVLGFIQNYLIIIYTFKCLSNNSSNKNKYSHYAQTMGTKAKSFFFTYINDT